MSEYEPVLHIHLEWDGQSEAELDAQHPAIVDGAVSLTSGLQEGQAGYLNDGVCADAVTYLLVGSRLGEFPLQISIAALMHRLPDACQKVWESRTEDGWKANQIGAMVGFVSKADTLKRAGLNPRVVIAI